MAKISSTTVVPPLCVGKTLPQSGDVQILATPPPFLPPTHCRWATHNASLKIPLPISSAPCVISYRWLNDDEKHTAGRKISATSAAANPYPPSHPPGVVFCGKLFVALWRLLAIYRTSFVLPSDHAVICSTAVRA